jgi:hypothetical protein
MTSDSITLVTTPGPANKIVTRDSKKHAPPIEEADAVAVEVPNLDALEAVLREISDDQHRCLILGVPPGKRLRILSQKKLRAELKLPADSDTPAGVQNGAVTRTKSNFRPSSVALLDYDVVPGMPDELRFASAEGWWAFMCRAVPGLEATAALILPSTSARILKDGQPAYSGSGYHAYIQVQNPEDIERFAVHLLLRGLLDGTSFMRAIFSKETGEITAHRPGSAYDPTTFSPERLVYDGAPTLRGAGLELLPIEPIRIPGGRLDTSLTEPLEADEATRIRREHGLSGKRWGGGWVAVQSGTLQPDTEIQTELGRMTVREFYRRPEQKLRCESTFRESTSQNGILRKDNRGIPFLFDNGPRLRHDLSDDGLAELIFGEDQ